MNTTQQQQLAAWDQTEAWLADYCSNLTDLELLQVVQECEDVHLAEGMLLSPLSFKCLAFAMMYEHRRRNGGFGREPFNPCEDQSL